MISPLLFMPDHRYIIKYKDRPKFAIISLIPKTQYSTISKKDPRLSMMLKRNGYLYIAFWCRRKIRLKRESGEKPELSP